MDEQTNQIEKLRRYVAAAEESLAAAKQVLSELDQASPAALGDKFNFSQAAKVIDGGKIIEGTFDGENMVGPEGKIYPVPANYASKSKLVAGDKLKLTVAEDGTFIFKQIGPAERKKIIGTLSFEDNAFHVLAEGKSYNVLHASVTYYKAKAGDKVTIVVPSNLDTNWATLDNIIHDVSEEPSKEPDETGLLEEIEQPDIFAEEAPIPPQPTPSDVFNLPKTEITPIIPGTTDVPTTEVPKSNTPTFEAVPAENVMPEESFLPREQNDEANSLGEKTASAWDAAATPVNPISELEI